MNDLTFNILKIVISASFAILTLCIVPYIRKLMEDEKYAQLLDIVEIAVRAAEQTMGAGEGKLKKQEVIDFVVEWMDDHGVVITEEQLHQLIEAAVFSMNLEIK